jgi:ABC-type branched-subunit amino acid transport system substrate-binding protein
MAIDLLKAMQRWLRFSAIGALVMVIACGGGSAPVGGATGPGVTADTIELGTTTPVTGPIAGVCTPPVQGMLAAFNAVNAQGGINGRKLHTTVLDDMYTAPAAVANIKTFQNQPVFAVVGGCGTIQAVAIAPQLNQQKIPYLLPSALNTGLYQPVMKYVFALMPGYDTQMTGLMPYAFKKFGAGSVYLINYQLPGYQAVAEATKSATVSGGGTYLGETDVANAQADYTPIALKIRDLKPDYVVIQVPATQAASAVNALDAQHALPTKAILGPTEIGSALQFAANVKSKAALAMTYTVQDVGDPNTPRADECKSIIAQYAPVATVGDANSIPGCAAGQIIIAGLKNAGKNLTRDGLVHGLESINNQTFSILPPVSFTPTKHVGLAKQYIATWNGTTPVYLDEF